MIDRKNAETLRPFRIAAMLTELGSDKGQNLCCFDFVRIKGAYLDRCRVDTIAPSFNHCLSVDTVAAPFIVRAKGCNHADGIGRG
jgi:hypothetical protein